MSELQFGRSEVCARINSISSGLAEDDLKAILTAKVLPHTVVVPKVDSLEDIRWVGVNQSVSQSVSKSISLLNYLSFRQLVKLHG